MEHNQQLKKYRHDDIATIKAELELPDNVKEAIADKTVDMEILATLIDCQQYNAAIQFLAFGLPKRESIWWSYVCAEQADGKSNDLNTQNALKNASDWVKSPSEERRQSAHTLAQALELYTPSSWTNMAIYWSGGSIAPKNQPDLEPEPLMYAHAVSNAIGMAAEQADNAAEQKKRFLRQGMHIAMGGNGRI